LKLKITKDKLRFTKGRKREKVDKIRFKEYLLINKKKVQTELYYTKNKELIGSFNSLRLANEKILELGKKLPFTIDYVKLQIRKYNGEYICGIFMFKKN